MYFIFALSLYLKGSNKLLKDEWPRRLLDFKQIQYNISTTIDILMPFDCCDNNRSEELSELARFLRVIAEENRLKIICLLLSGEKCVCELWQNLKLPQNLVSHHLKVLKTSGLITSRKKGLKVIYSLNEENVGQYLDKIINLVKK